MQNPYVSCPTFFTQKFTLRLVSINDSKDLLQCYSDSKAQKFFNIDKCFGDFCMYKNEDMILCIKSWLDAYEREEFIRFSIVDQSLVKAVGTVEMFGYVGKYKTKTGILRVDINSSYENIEDLSEIFEVSRENFFGLFDIDTIATKAIPEATERIKVLLDFGFIKSQVNEGINYYLLSNKH